MATTATAFSGEGASIQIVVAIEGYPYLLTDGATADAVTAWAGTDWTQALSGLTVNWSGMEQSIDPWARDIDVPTLTFRVIDYDGNDRFGIDTHAEYAGEETDGASALPPTRTKVPGRDVSDFAASGSIYIGPENIGYTSTVVSGTGGDYFDGITRGRYAPFKADSESSQRFARYHNAGTGVIEQRLRISDAPRKWVGRFVSVHVHTKDDSGLNTRAQAALVFAGRITAVRDQSDGATLVECEDIRALIRDATVLRYQFGATIRPGIWLTKRSGQSYILRARDFNAGSIRYTKLRVVDRQPTSEYEIATGFYTAAEFEDKLNVWLQKAKTDNNLYYAWNVQLDADTEAGRRCKFTVTNSTSLVGETFEITSYDKHVSGFIGFEEVASDDGNVLFTAYGDGTRHATFTTELSPTKYPTNFDWNDTIDQDPTTEGWRLVLDDPRGVWTTISDHSPQTLSPRLGTTAGFLKVSDGSILVAQRMSDDLFQVQPFFRESQGAYGGFKSIRWDESQAELTVSQLVVLEGRFATLLTKFLASTGEAEYNHENYDALPLGMGAGIPWELLGDQWINTIRAMGEASSPSLWVIDKPTPLWDLIKADMCIRRINIIFKSGTLQAASWSTPTNETGLLVLSDDNRAMDAGTAGIDPSPMQLTSEHLVTQVTIKYNRNLQGQYQDTIVFRDDAAVSDHGMTKALTIELRNTHAMLPRAEQHVVNLAAGLAAWLPLLSRPLRLMRRSVDLGHVLDVGPGDHALVTDLFARDPATGERGLTEKPAVVLRHRWDLGGAGAPFTAEVDVIIAPIDRVGLYAPCAELDETADSGGFSSGYNSGTLTLRCHEHRYSQATQGADASFFNQSDAIRIIEMDAESTSLVWERTIQSISGNDIVIDSALSAPAFDATKKYRIIYGAYTAATVQQQAKVFIADDEDGWILDTVRANRWSKQVADTTPVTAVDTTGTNDNFPVMFVDSHAYEEGYSLNTGHERDICNVLNNAIDYRCAPIGHYAISNDDGGNTNTSSDTMLTHIIPFSYGGNIPTGYRRRLYVRPGMTNLTASAGTLTITMSNRPPSGPGRVNSGGVKEFGFPSSARQLSWIVPARTDAAHIFYSMLDEQNFDLTALGPAGFVGYLCIELSPNVYLGSLSKSVGPLERVINTWDERT